MVKKLYVMPSQTRAIVTYYSYGKNACDAANPLPFASHECEILTESDGSRCFSFDTSIHGWKYYSYRYDDSDPNVFYAKVYYTPIEFVTINGVEVDIEDTVKINGNRYLKYDNSIFFNGTEDKWCFKEDYDIDDMVCIDNRYYDEDDEDIVYAADDEEYHLKEDCSYCDRCNEWTYNVSMHTVYVSGDCQEEWCDSCCDNHAFYCDDCGYYHSSHDYSSYYIENSGYYVCEDCYEDNYHYCEECDSNVHNNNWNYNYECCDRCAEENHGHDRRVHSYHDSHRKVIHYFKNGQQVEYSSDLKCFGFELEADDGDSPDDVIGAIEETSTNELIFNFEHDGSLSCNGFETISYPMDFATFKAADWETFLKCYSDNGYKSDQAHNSCSLHMHFNRPAFFGNSTRSQENSVAKLYVFFRKYWDDLVKASRRRNLGWCDLDEHIKHCSPELAVIQRSAEYCAKNCKCNDHHTAINQGNLNTIEIRLGKGTLNPLSFRAWVDLMYHVMNNIKKIPFARAHEGTLWLKGISPQTKTYLRNRKAFLSILGEAEDADINIAVAEPSEN